MAEERGRVVALNLMRMALALLERGSEGLGAARLQHAIDEVEGVQPDPPTRAQIDRFISLPADQTD